MILRLLFALFAAVAVSGAAYVSYMGYGAESRDLDRSVRVGSPGAAGINRSVK